MLVLHFALCKGTLLTLKALSILTNLMLQIAKESLQIELIWSWKSLAALIIDRKLESSLNNIIG